MTIMAAANAKIGRAARRQCTGDKWGARGPVMGYFAIMVRKFSLTFALLFIPSIAWAQCNGVFGSQQVCGSVSGGAPTATAINSLAIANSAAFDLNFCSTVGATLTRQTSGWICSTTQGTSSNIPTGTVFGAPGLNTTEPNISVNNSGPATQTFATTLPVSASIDWRWNFTGPAPTLNQLVGPNFYTVASPSTNVDNHNAVYSGINATAYSESGTTLGFLAGGNFNAIRRNTGAGGSTNPIVGVIGSGVMGIAGDPGAATGDGVFGGIFTSYPALTQSGAPFDPQATQGAAGLVGRVFDVGSTASDLSTLDNIGVAGYSNVEGNTINAYGLWSQVDSRTKGMSVAMNAYGLFIKDVSGTQNVNAAIRTGKGTVIFGGSSATSGNVIGGMRIAAIGQPTINKVKGGATGQFSEPFGPSGYNNNGTSTYTYQIVPKFTTGVNGAPSPASSTTSGFGDLTQTGQNNYIQWTPVEGAISYDVYRTVAPSPAVTNTTGKIANVLFDAFPQINGTPLTQTPPSFADVGAVGDASSPPAQTTPVLQVDGTATNFGTGKIIAGSLISSGTPLQLGVNGGPQWQLDSSGNLSAVNDTAYDIGQPLANRPRNLYLSGTLQLSATTIASLPTCTAAATGRMLYVTNGFSPVTYNLKVSSASTSAWTYPVFCGTDPTSVNAFAWTYH